jgi:hypothetical protein
MKIVVVFESMFGNTHHIADAIAEGLAPYGSVSTVNVNDPISLGAASSADLLVLGGPTHVHGMSRPASRNEASSVARGSEGKLTLEPRAPGIGVRDWMDDLDTVPAQFAAFDTRVDVARIISGSAADRIEHTLSRQGSHALVEAASFVVSKGTVLEEGELDRARAWGVGIGKAIGLLQHA